MLPIKPRLFLPLQMSILLLGSACSTVPDHDPAAAESAPRTEQAAIQSVIEATAAANNAGDVDRWVALFADGAVYMPPGAPAVTTRQGLIEIAEAGFRHDADLEIEPVEIVVVGDLAYARNHVTGTITLQKSRDVIPIDMKQIVIYERRDGVWKISRMIANRNGE